MLEILVHSNIGRIPTTHCYVTADVPEGLTVEYRDDSNLPDGWNSENSTVARDFGDLWLKESRSAILIVPSVIAKLDKNALVNPVHPESKQLIVSEPQKIIWDKRLFK